MGDWFRNRDWDDEIAAAFDARLGRARGKAQYLNIQAYTLLTTRPAVAAKLAQRAIEIGDAQETARAGLYRGTALALTGDVDGAIAALEGAIEAQARAPTARTGAYLDQALLIAVAGRDDLYQRAWGRLADERALPLAQRPLSAIIAQALIGAARGEDVAEEAALALGELGDVPASEAGLAPYLNLALVKRRLAEAG